MQILLRCLAIVLFCAFNQKAETDSTDSEGSLPPIGHTYFCLRYAEECQQTGPQPHWPKSIEKQQTQLAAINQSVNDNISPKVDTDVVDTNWLIDPPEGDCDDFAVTKRHKLLRAGWASSDLLLAEVTLISTREHHLILIAKTKRGAWVLDNRNSEIKPLAETRNEYVWNRIESRYDPKLWTTSFASL